MGIYIFVHSCRFCSLRSSKIPFYVVVSTMNRFRRFSHSNIEHSQEEDIRPALFLSVDGFLFLLPLLFAPPCHYHNPMNGCCFFFLKRRQRAKLWLNAEKENINSVVGNTLKWEAALQPGNCIMLEENGNENSREQKSNEKHSFKLI